MKEKNKRIDFITGGTESEDNYVDADFLNQAQEELENVVRASGFAFDGNNEQQVAQAITDHALGASYAEDTGTANNYILSITGSRQAPPVLVKGYRLFFQTGNVNTSTTPTLNYAGLGVKTIVAENGTDAIVAGDIKVGAYNEVVYDGTNWTLILSKVNSASETVAGGIKITTSAQALAGTDNTSAMTPAKLFEKLSAVKEVTTITSTTDVNGAVVKNGYTITRDISTGAIIGKKVFGWVKTISPDNGVNQVFPIAFTALYSANCCIANASPNNDATPDQPVHITSLSLTGLRVSNSSSNNTIDASYVIKGI